MTREAVGAQHRQDGLLDVLPFPAAKDEVVERLATTGATPELVWLVEAMPGTEFHFVSDVVSTARIALEMQIRRAWPEHSAPRSSYTSADGVVDAVRRRLLLCGQTNHHLIKVTVQGDWVVLTGRTPDVPRGVMATRVAAGVVPAERVRNELQVTS